MILSLENCADFVRSSTPEAVKAAVSELYQAEDAAKEALRQKVAAYFETREQRYQRIVAQIASVEEQRQAVEAEKAQHSRALVEATVNGDSALIHQIQGEMERVESRLASFGAQLEAFRSYELRGDETIAAEIAQDRAALDELISVNSQIRDAMYQITEQIKNAWARAVYNPDTYGKGVTGYRESWMDAVDRVQNDQKKAPQTVGQRLNAKAEADKKAEATRQRSAAAPGVVFLPGQ